MTIGTLAIASGVVELIKAVGRLEGKIERAVPVEFNGAKGFLVWDYIIWNEIYFVSNDKKINQTLFTSISDKETAKRFEGFASKYGTD